ncbi:MAG: hypothetical protein ACFFD4_20500 [Candidatus Odinarchaeota archaeon]
MQRQIFREKTGKILPQLVKEITSSEKEKNETKKLKQETPNGNAVRITLKKGGVSMYIGFLSQIDGNIT